MPFLPQRCFSPTLKQWHVTWYSPWKHSRPGIVLAIKLKRRQGIFLKIIKNFPKKVRNKAKNRIFSEISSANLTCCETYLKEFTRTFRAMFYLSTFLQWFASYRWKIDEKDDKSAFAVPKGPFRVNSREVVKVPSPFFLKFYSNCHYPMWWTSAKFKWKLSRNGMIIKLFSWEGVARGHKFLIFGHVWSLITAKLH